VSAALRVGVANTSYDVTRVWLVLWQLCIARRSWHLFGNWHLMETHCLLEHRCQNSGTY